MTDKTPIKFFRRGKYFEFSNFYPIDVKIDGKIWQSTEHYYQAMKFKNKEYMEHIRNARTPYIAFCMGRQKYPQGKNYKDVNVIIKKYKKIVKFDTKWDINKIKIMVHAVKEKFKQNKKLKKLLIGTGNRKLIENSPYDKYWGQNNKGIGKNMLGKILMKLRNKIEI